MSLLFHTVIYLLYLAILAGILIMVSVSMKTAWARERAVLRELVLEKFGLADDERQHRAARKRILALVPCQADLLDGSLAVLGDEKHVWLCFLAECVLVLPSGGGDVVEVPYPDLQGLYLLDRGKGDGHGIALEAGGEKSLLTVSRLDDVVRIVNVLIQRHIVLGYHSRED